MALWSSFLRPSLSENRMFFSVWIEKSHDFTLQSLGLPTPSRSKKERKTVAVISNPACLCVFLAWNLLLLLCTVMITCIIKHSVLLITTHLHTANYAPISSTVVPYTHYHCWQTQGFIRSSLQGCYFTTMVQIYCAYTPLQTRYTMHTSYTKKCLGCLPIHIFKISCKF